MVIACPNCARKYQIDTSRIPSGGTSFTCWSCRATVSVDTGGGTTATAEPHPGDTEPLASPSVERAPRTAESTIPLSAMRFFESLAAEASMNKQMAGQAQKPTEPIAAAPEPGEPPHIEGTRPMASQPPGALPRLADEQTMRLMTGDDVLDLPNLVPVSTPESEAGVVVEIAPPKAAGEEEAVPPLAFAPVESAAAPPEPLTRTRAFSSAPPEPPVVETPPQPPEPVPVVAAPRQRTAPTPIPLPASLQASAPVIPAQPVLPKPEPSPVRPPRPMPPPVAPVAVRSPGPVSEPPVEPAEPPKAPVPPVRQTPADYAVATPHAWVAPEVEPRSRRSRRPLALLAVVAILIVGVSAFLLWRGPLRELISPSSVASNPQPSPPSAPTPTSTQVPAPAPALMQPPEKTEPTTTAPTPTTTAPAGTGGFTVQVRSSPNEADARASAEALKGAGFDAYVARADLGARGVWYRVRVGRFASRDEAQKAVAKLRGTGRVSDAIIQTYEGP